MSDIFAVQDILNLIVSFTSLFDWSAIAQVNKNFYQAFLINKKRLRKNLTFLVSNPQKDMELVLENQTYKFPAYNIFKACIPDPSNRDIINPYSEDEIFTLHACFTMGDIDGEIKIRVSEKIIFKILIENYFKFSAESITLWNERKKSESVNNLVNLIYVSFYENIEKYIDFQKIRRYRIDELKVKYKQKNYIFQHGLIEHYDADFYNLIVYALKF